MALKLGFLLTLALLLPYAGASAQNVIEDEGVTISRQEFEQLVQHWTPEMQQAAANSGGDRLELINMALASKKIAQQAQAITAESDPDAYWRQVFQIRNMQRQLVVTRYMGSLAIPDMTELSKERYYAEKDKYALVPEKRVTSHILLLCPPASCNRDELRPVADNIHTHLMAGANFEELVEQHSQDPGSKDKGGVFDKWFFLGEAGVSPHYTGGAFEIENVGGYSSVVDSQYGLHIIRLDGLEEAHYKPYEEVKIAILFALKDEYLEASAKEFDASFRITDDAMIDGEAMEEIFGPFKAPAMPK
jgi:peptidyl-prolyl cis-trans isomerase C